MENADRFPVMARTGKATTDSIDMRSAKTLMPLLPNRAISTPPNGATMSDGTAETATTRPAKNGEPVTSKTSHGMVIMTTALETPEKKLEI
jgi:hypothetical protein